MDLKRMRYLETIYRLKSFTKAAEALYISQPSLSNAIQELEKELGVTLIIRSRPPLHFTQAGERFMWHVYRILGDVQEAEEDMKELSADRTQSILMTWPQITANDGLLTKIYMEFCAEYPQYDLVMTDDSYRGSMTRLLSEDIDLAMLHLPDGVDLSKFIFTPIARGRVFAVLPEDHFLAEEDYISLKMLENETLLTFRPDSLIRIELDKAAEKADASLSITSVNQIEAAKKLVLDGHGITFMTMDDLFPESAEPGLVFRPLTDSIILQKGLLQKPGRPESQAVARLTDFILQTVASLRA